MAAVPIDDREIANVVTYVRQAWGNDFGEMTTDEVATIRSDTVDQKDQWIGEALQSIYLTSSSKN